MERDDLDQALLRAHAEGDSAALIRLYSLAADAAEGADEMDRACFYLTHAFVFALESGAPEADPLNARLAAQGRAHRLVF
ncbi:hypothetical protein PhaeoP18_03846 (plasmid) [Phaeobacter piscinae]|uniref:Uncharacterized protein n=1 Tax=Phaeobacter piscinae TaxID=1580596 RepID=A0AAN1GUQ6_9RHOB|nr:hypothetical protein [Phaeobacter piscinae]ATG45500.1 hypothetical protein PhaeoP13_03618 [Phaeobacter piscinae]AUR38062.1 hypothetical protein PhaeoP18_03846 [Phaeobacter piscinae]